MISRALCSSSRACWLFIAAAPILLSNCSSNDSKGGSGGSNANGGSANGGASTAQGGSSSGGAASGGAASGATSGGAASGGASSGGASSGGSATAGTSSGGVATGGAASAGQNGSSGGSAGATGTGGAASAGAAGSTGTGGGSSGTFTLASADMMDGAKFDTTFTCNGGSIGMGLNPELHWSGAPAGTMSFAITFIDTTIGASKQMGQHWAMWNIPASVMKLPKGTTAPAGDFANAKQSGKYLAPCAISLVGGMDDEYEFTVYALSSATLNVSGSSVANALTALGVLPNGMLVSSVLGKATFHGHAGVGGK